MKSKKIEIEIVSPDLTDEMIKSIVDSIKSVIQEKHITDNLAFDIEVKDNNINNFPILPQHPYRDFPHDNENIYPNTSPTLKKEIYPGYPNKIMCGNEKTYLNTNNVLYQGEGGIISDYATEKAKLEKSIQ